VAYASKNLAYEVWFWENPAGLVEVGIGGKIFQIWKKLEIRPGSLKSGPPNHFFTIFPLFIQLL
jgi:hypothetical protein